MTDSELTDSAEAQLRTEATTSIVGYRLRRAQLAIFQRFLETFEALGLRPAEYSVLVLVADNPGRKQTEIAEALGIKRTNFVALVHELEHRGLVERRASEADRRANGLFLTTAGAEFLATARLQHDALEAEVVARLGGPAARAQLLALLEKLV